MAKPNMMYAFDHIPVLSNTTGGNMAAYAADYPFTFTANGQQPFGGGGTYSDSDGVWMQSASAAQFIGSAYVLAMGTWRLPASAIWTSTQPRSYVGFHFKISGNLPPVPSATGILGYYQGATLIPLVAYADFAWTVGQMYYVEVMLDRTTNARTVWVDGNMAINAAALASTSYAGTDQLSFCNTYAISGQSVTSGFNYKDIYGMDDVIGAGATGRLGPITSKPITIANATGNGWTPSTGSISSALNTAINTTTPSTPNVVTAIDGTPLAATLQSTADAGAVIQGVLLIAAGSKNPATGTMLRSTLSDQAQPPNVVTLNAVPLPASTFVYGKVMGFLPSAPDGSSWNAAKIAALNASIVASAT